MVLVDWVFRLYRPGVPWNSGEYEKESDGVIECNAFVFGAIVVGAFCCCIPDGDEDDADDHGEWMFYGVEAACAVGHGFTGKVFESKRG